MVGLILVYSMFYPLYAGDCWKITSKDQKAYCEAMYEGKNSCWKIKNKDQRYMCESIAQHKNSCWRIKNKDKRNYCEASKGL